MSVLVPIQTSGILLLLILNRLMLHQVVSAWSAEWKALDSSLQPPRSGHVAFKLDDSIYVFGGYAEEDGERYPTNDLWKWKNREQEWMCVHPSDLWSPQDSSSNHHDTRTSTHTIHTIPQQRLAAAAASLSGTAFVFGGWDSQQPGTGGVILNNIDCVNVHEDLIEWSSDPAINLGAPTSRLVALSIADSTILIHNHRCTKSVLLVRKKQNSTDVPQVTTQATTGPSPSPRGLHAAAFLPPDQVVIFGGADQSGEMSNEVFLLNTRTWVWKKLDFTGPQPTPRASPCLCALDDSTCVLFGGADRSLVHKGIPLHGCDDLWILNVHQARWEQLTPTNDVMPPGRNAATLTPISNDDDDDNGSDGSKSFLLVGGWYPFQSTHSQTFVLNLKRNIS